MDPATVPLIGDRWTPFTHEIEYQGEDFSGATFAMQVRLTYDASGPAPVSLATVTTSSAEGVRLIYGGTATIDAHIAAGRMSEVPDGALGSDVEALSVIGIRINKSTMGALPFPPERGNDATMFYDLHITPTGALEEVAFRGSFTIRAGSTQL